MISIGDISKRIPSNVGLTERHYAAWLDHNWDRLDGLKRANCGDEKAKGNAIELFICFQAFHIYFKCKGLDRIQLNEDYELWRDVIIPFFDEDQYYGELEYIHNEGHAKMIIERMELLDKELDPSVVSASTGESLIKHLNKIVKVASLADKAVLQSASKGRK